MQVPCRTSSTVKTNTSMAMFINLTTHSAFCLQDELLLKFAAPQELLRTILKAHSLELVVDEIVNLNLSAIARLLITVAVAGICKAQPQSHY